MAVLSKGCKPNNFQSHNSLKLSFTNIRGLCSNFVECESFLQSNSDENLALCETNLGNSSDSGNFSVKGYFPLIRKDSITHMHGFAVYVKEGLPFPWDYLRKTLQILTYAFDWLSLSLCMVLILSHLTWTKFSQSTHLLMCLSLETLTYLNLLTYSGGTDRPRELCFNFSISNDLTQMVNFPFRISDCNFQSTVLLFFSFF